MQVALARIDWHPFVCAPCQLTPFDVSLCSRFAGFGCNFIPASRGVLPGKTDIETGGTALITVPCTNKEKLACGLLAYCLLRVACSVLFKCGDTAAINSLTVVSTAEDAVALGLASSQEIYRSYDVNLLEVRP